MTKRGQDEDEVCQRSLCGPERGAGNHLRVSAGIRFYAEEGGAGNHPRRIAAGIRFYAEEGGAGNHPRRIAAGIRFYAEEGGAGNHLRVSRRHPLLRQGRRSRKSSAIKRGHPRSWGKLAGGMSRGLSSAARERGHPRRDGAAGKGAERERWLLWTSSVGLMGCQGTRGWVGAKGGGACRWPGGPIPLGYDGPMWWPCDSWDSFGPFPG